MSKNNPTYRNMRQFMSCSVLLRANTSQKEKGAFSFYFRCILSCLWRKFINHAIWKTISVSRHWTRASKLNYKNSEYIFKLTFYRSTFRPYTSTVLCLHWVNIFTVHQRSKMLNENDKPKTCGTEKTFQSIIHTRQNSIAQTSIKPQKNLHWSQW